MSRTNGSDPRRRGRRSRTATALVAVSTLAIGATILDGSRRRRNRPRYRRSGPGRECGRFRRRVRLRPDHDDRRRGRRDGDRHQLLRAGGCRRRRRRADRQGLRHDHRQRRRHARRRLQQDDHRRRHQSRPSAASASTSTAGARPRWPGGGDLCDPAEKDKFTHVSNVIIQNLSFRNSRDDSINVQCYSDHVWVNYNTFYTAYDGSVDVKRGSDLVDGFLQPVHRHRQVDAARPQRQQRRPGPRLPAGHLPPQLVRRLEHPAPAGPVRLRPPVRQLRRRDRLLDRAGHRRQDLRRGNYVAAAKTITQDFGYGQPDVDVDEQLLRQVPRSPGPTSSGKTMADWLTPTTRSRPRRTAIRPARPRPPRRPPARVPAVRSPSQADAGGSGRPGRPEPLPRFAQSALAGQAAEPEVDHIGPGRGGDQDAGAPAAGPSCAGPSCAGPSCAGPSCAGPSCAGPSCAGPTRR